MNVYWYSIACSCRKQVLQTNADAEKDGVVVPRTLEEYCIKPKPQLDLTIDDDDFVDEDYYEDDEYDSEYGSDEDDSGNEESWQTTPSLHPLLCSSG